MRTRREHIEASIDTLFMKWLYYDRKECDSLPVGSIEKAVEEGEITKQEILDLFIAEIEDAFK